MFSDKMKAAIDDLKAKFNLTMNMHSGDRMMANLASYPSPDAPSFAIEIHQNTDGSLETEVYSVIGFTMLQIKSGRFSYPNKAFDRTVRQLQTVLSTIDTSKL